MSDLKPPASTRLRAGVDAMKRAFDKWISNGRPKRFGEGIEVWSRDATTRGGSVYGVVDVIGCAVLDEYRTRAEAVKVAAELVADLRGGPSSTFRTAGGGVAIEAVDDDKPRAELDSDSMRKG